MKFNIVATVILQPEVKPGTLVQVLAPENQTKDQTNIQSNVVGDKVETKIIGEMKINTLIRTIDDILQTAYLTDQVAESTNSK